MQERDLIVGKKYIALNYIISETEILKQLENSHRALMCQISKEQIFYLLEILKDKIIIKDNNYYGLWLEVPKKLFLENFVPIENYYYNLFSSFIYPKIGEIWKDKKTNELYNIQNTIMLSLNPNPDKLFQLEILPKKFEEIQNAQPFKISLQQFILEFDRVE